MRSSTKWLNKHNLSSVYQISFFAIIHNFIWYKNVFATVKSTPSVPKRTNKGRGDRLITGFCSQYFKGTVSRIFDFWFFS
jgi:hypothetical protein